MGDVVVRVDRERPLEFGLGLVESLLPDEDEAPRRIRVR
jgi:hypothetical protein